MNKALLILLMALLPLPTLAYKGPVIDMHFHALPGAESGGPELPRNQATTAAAMAALQEYNIVLAAISGPEAYLDAWPAKLESTELLKGVIFPCVAGKNPSSRRYSCYRPEHASADGNFPDIDWLRAQYASGNYAVMGELYNQYAGISFNDPQMHPYYALAEELGIPVAFHTQSGPPLTARLCCPAFRLANGNPLLLEDILIRYPKLNVQIMHANPLVYPEVLDLLIQFPKVYVDISPWQLAYTREKFHRLIKEYADAGLSSRILFGSDGHDFGKALAAYESAEFLSEAQLEGILCKNAERFLGRKGLCDKPQD